jgi:DNA-3-methyladenine glycosylase II
LTVQAPFHLEATVRVLQRRPSNLIDRWLQQRYRRVIFIGARPALIEVANYGTIDRPDTRLSIARADDVRGALAPRERTEAARVARAILGLGVDPGEPQRRAERDPALRATAIALRGLRPPRYPDLFETFANVIPFQQLSLDAGMSVVTKLVRHFGQELMLADSRYFIFPRSEDIADAPTASLRRCGLSRHKAYALQAAARAIASGTLNSAILQRLPSSNALQYLQQLPGIGPWSAALILLRGLGRVDVFPQADSGAEGSLAALMHLHSRSSLSRIVERFGDHRGFLYFYGLASRLLAAGLIQPAAAPARSRNAGHRSAPS